MDNIFRTALDKVSGLRFFNGPTGLFGFWRGVIVASPIGSRNVFVSKQLLMILANLSCTELVEYLRSSFGMPSGPVALPFFKLFAAVLISSPVNGISSGHGGPMKGDNGASPQVSCFSK